MKKIILLSIMSNILFANNIIKGDEVSFQKKKEESIKNFNIKKGNLLIFIKEASFCIKKAKNEIALNICEEDLFKRLDERINEEDNSKK
jgi:hypothetical protein